MEEAVDRLLQMGLVGDVTTPDDVIRRLMSDKRYYAVLATVLKREYVFSSDDEIASYAARIVCGLLRGDVEFAKLFAEKGGLQKLYANRRYDREVSMTLKRLFRASKMVQEDSSLEPLRRRIIEDRKAAKKRARLQNDDDVEANAEKRLRSDADDAIFVRLKSVQDDVEKILNELGRALRTDDDDEDAVEWDSDSSDERDDDDGEEAAAHLPEDYELNITLSRDNAPSVGDDARSDATRLLRVLGAKKATLTRWYSAVHDQQLKKVLKSLLLRVAKAQKAMCLTTFSASV